MKETYEPLSHNQTSKSGLYGIYSNTKGKENILLRICLDKETAKMYTPNNDRRIEAVYLIQENN